MKIAYCGYDFFFECLKTIDSAGHSVISIFTNECDNHRYVFNTEVQKFASSRGIPFTDRKIDASDLKHLQEIGCDLLISAAYPYRIPIETAPNLAAVNLHPTLLPVGRGPWPLPHIILKELKTSGVTMHLLKPQFDAGPVVVQKSFAVDERENLETLSCKVKLAALEVMRTFLADPASLMARGIDQSSLGMAEYWPRPTNEERTLDWNMPVRSIDRIARAFGKFNSFATFDDAEWIVDDVSVWEASSIEPPGTVVLRTPGEVVVAAKNGYVCIRVFEMDPDFARDREVSNAS
jgi:methionyl-tRNA formyltransferase